jgi:hypothetical protein
MECDDGSDISPRDYGGRKDRVMGPPAARGGTQGDWAGFWQATLIDLQLGGTAWRHPSSCPASLAVGTDALGARQRPQFPDVATTPHRRGASCRA